MTFRFGRRALLGGAVVVAAGCWGRRRPGLGGRRIANNVGPIRTLLFTPDGQQAILGGADDARLIRVLDLRTGKIARALEVPGWVHHLALHEPSGLLAVSGWASANGGHYVAILDFAQGRVLRIIEKGRLGIDGVWLARNDRLVTSYSDRGLPEFSRLWDLASGRLVRDLPFPVDDVAADGRTALGGPLIWDLEEQRVKATFPRGSSRAEVWGVAISPDGTRAVSQRGSGSLWNDRGAIVRRFADQPRWIWAAAFSPDDRFLLTAADTSSWGPSRHGLVLRDAHTGAPLADCVGHTGPILAVAFSPDGRRALSADRRGNVFLWAMPLA